MKYDGMPRPKAKAKEPSLDTARDANRIRRVDKTYLELKQQGLALKRTLEYTKSVCPKMVEDLKDRRIDRVVLLGCGDSWFVGTCLEVLIERLLGCPCQSYDAFEFFSFRCNVLNEHSVVIGQSASGTTSSVLGALAKASEKGAYTVGISNTENAEILHSSDFGLLVQAKREGWPTQATSSAIVAVAYIFAVLAKERGFRDSYCSKVLCELESLESKVEEAICLAEPVMKKNAPLFVNSSFFQATGAGPLFGAAQISCAKLRELCPVQASCYPLEEFHHYRTLKSKDPLVLFVGTSGQREVDTALVGAYDGGMIIAIGSQIDPEISKVCDLECIVPLVMEELQPVVSMVAAHLFAYYLAKAKYDANIGYPSEV